MPYVASAAEDMDGSSTGGMCLIACIASCTCERSGIWSPRSPRGNVFCASRRNPDTVIHQRPVALKTGVPRVCNPLDGMSTEHSRRQVRALGNPRAFRRVMTPLKHRAGVVRSADWPSQIGGSVGQPESATATSCSRSQEVFHGVRG